MWILFGFLCALFHSLGDLFYRKAGKGESTELLTFGRMAYTSLVLWIFVLIEGIPEFGDDLLRAYYIGIPLELIATILYMKALQNSPLSIVAPLFAFSPAFILITGPIFLGEYTSVTGALGVLVIVVGAYLLNVSQVKMGYWEPFKSLSKERGARYMIGAALLFSITANMGRLGVTNSSPAFFGASYFTIIALILLIPVLRRKEFKRVTNRSVVIPGLAIALSVVFHLKGVELIQAGYFIAIKRLSMIISILLGIVILKEKSGKERLIGGTIMMLGVLIIILLR